MSKKMISETRNYYKTTLITLITLWIPTILEEVFSTLLQYVDMAMVGHLGEKATAAVSTITKIYGYASVDELYNKVVTANADSYEHEDNVDENTVGAEDTK